VVIDLNVFDELRTSRGWTDAETARRMDIRQSSITRIRDGANPGVLFIDGALTAFEVPYEKLFSRRSRVKT
jgi:transcriptional regulator with XRE-family HTH domain